MGELPQVAPFRVTTVWHELLYLAPDLNIGSRLALHFHLDVFSFNKVNLEASRVLIYSNV